MQLAEQAQCLNPIHLRHHQVQQDKRDIGRQQLRQGSRMGCGAAVQAQFQGGRGNKLSDILFIIDHQDRDGVRHRCSLRLPRLGVEGLPMKRHKHITF